MKKFLSIFLLLAGMPVFALCSIGDGESICTIQNNSNASIPLFQQTQGTTMNGSSSTSMQLQPSRLNNSFQQNQNKNGIDINSSMGCQFGNCNQGLNNSFLKNE